MDYRIFNMHTDVNACNCTQGCMRTTSESALKADSGRKIPCRTRESNLHWRCEGPLLYQLSYIPTLPQACMPDSVLHLFEVYEVVEQITLLLQVLLCDDSTIKDLFCCVRAWSKACLFSCQQFLSLGLESAEDN